MQILGRIFALLGPAGRSLVAILLLGAGAACTPGDRGGPGYEPSIDNPLAIKLTWFRYVGGEDIRRSCQAGSADFYRFVYNGHYNEQIRSYEVAPIGEGASGGGAAVTTRVLTGAGIAAQVNLRFDDVLASWRWTRSDDRMTPGEFARFSAAMAESGVFAPPPVGKRLHSNAFYWVASGCRGGTFFLNAWVFPSERYASLTFPNQLLLFDGTGIALNPPRPRDLDESIRAKSINRNLRLAGAGVYFELEVGQAGLRGL
ncbi:MAG: hypothetical protein ACFCUQ_22640 [Kiloniellales bacterium]